MKESQKREEYEAFLQKLKKSFGDMEIVTLKEIVKNISLSPSVRSGDKKRLEPNLQYCEVGLRDIDEQGVVSIERCKDKKLGDASRYLVEKYALKENDLLLPYRASRNIKVVRVGSDYPTPLVTNASVIRIEMYEDTPKDLAMIIQAYLCIPYVQRYVLPKEVYSRERPFSRHLLSTKALADLPIPKFTSAMVAKEDFSQLYLRRLQIEHKTVSLHRKSMDILKCIIKDEDETISLFLYKKQKLSALKEKELNIINKLDALLDELELLKKECANTNL
ncbi:MAG: hypothetical protein QM497_03320 [Sulfurimonas sp.]